MKSQSSKMLESWEVFISSIPEDGKYTETITNAMKIFGGTKEGSNALQDVKRSNRLREPARETAESNNRTKHACNVEAHESTRNCFGIHYQEVMKITSLEKGSSR